MKKRVFLILFPLMLLIFLSACSTATGDTEIQVFFQEVYISSRNLGLLGATLGAALLAGLIAAFVESCGVGVGLLAILTLINVPIVRVSADSLATKAITAEWEAAKLQQAETYEFLLSYWESASITRHKCSYSFVSKSETNCRYVVESCDEDDNCDYTPMFIYELTMTAVLNVYTDDVVRFGPGNYGYRIAPRNARYGLIDNLPLFGFNGMYVDDPALDDFYTIKEAVDRGELMFGGVRHLTHNYFVANPASLQISGLPSDNTIAWYEENGLLGTIDPITVGPYHTLDHDFVHFVGGLRDQLDLELADSIQERARFVAGDAGRNREAYLFIVLAPEDEIDNHSEWTLSQKAYLMNKQRFGKWVLPKNTLGLTCTVDASQITVTACELFTGMFSGNERLAVDVRGIEPFPLTPDAFFGNVEGTLENGVVETERAGGVFDVVYDFVRQEMSPNDYLLANIEPTEEQKQRIKSNASLGLASRAFAVYFIVVAVLVAGKAKLES